MWQVIRAGVLAAALGVASWAQAIPVVSAGSATVTVGDTFIIPVSITGAIDLESWQFDLGFDAAILQANAVTEGPFLSSSGSSFTLFVPGFIDNGAGLISLVSDSYVDVPPGPSGDGVLAHIEFTAIAAGISPLTLSSVFLNLSQDGFEVANGRVCVNPAGATPCTDQLPAPGTLALLATGFALLAWRRRWTSMR